MAKTGPSNITDDDVLAWWEAYDAGESVKAIAKRLGHQAKTVERHLELLGVVEDPLTAAALAGELSASDQAIFEALGRINVVDAPGERREVRWARSMQHVKPGMRAPIVQSGRQRRQDRMASVMWRRVVRRDLAASGLLPRP